MWLGLLRFVNAPTLVQAVVSIPAFRQTVTTTYCKETHKHQERTGTQTKTEKETGDRIRMLATVETININAVQ